MNIDDPKFTAYALDALPVGEKEAVEPGILADKELWHEAEVTAAFAEKLKQAFTAEHNARLSDAHWREIFAEVGVEESPGVIPLDPVQPRRMPVWALSAAAGVMAGAVIASLAITWGEHPVSVTEAKPAKPPVIAEKPVPTASIMIPTSADLPVIEKPEALPAKLRGSVAFVPRPVGESLVASRTADTVVKVTPAFGSRRESIPSAVISSGTISVAGITPEEDASEPPQYISAQPTGSVSIPAIAGARVLIVPAKLPAPLVPATASVAASSVNNQKSVSVTEARKKSTFPQNIAGTVAVGGTRKAQPSSNDLIFSTTPASPSNDANRISQGIAIAPEVPTLGIAGVSHLNTLGDVNAVMEHDGALTASFAASDLILSGQSAVFSLLANPDVKYTIVLANGGIPLHFAPSSTAVLEVSAPFTIRSAP